PVSATLLPYTTLFRSVDGATPSEGRTAAASPAGASGAPAAAPGATCRRTGGSEVVRASPLTASHHSTRGPGTTSSPACCGTSEKDRKSTRLNSSHVKI